MKNSLKSLFLISALALSTSAFAETKADVVDDAEKNLSRMERVVAAVQGAFEALSSSEEEGEDSEDNFFEKAAKKAKAKFLEVTKIEITEDTKEAAALAKVSLKNAKEYSTELRKVLTQMVLKKSDDVAVQTANKAKVNELVKKI